MQTINESMRLDKWLWAARFFKTRSLAQKQIELGRVLVNGVKVKNSKMISIGDIIELTLNGLPYKMTVLKLNTMRRPAPEAKQLYMEDQPTVQLREKQKELDKMSRITAAYPDGRPTKRDRRALTQLKQNFWS